MIRNIFNWELLDQFEKIYYKDVINLIDVSDEEKAIFRKKEYPDEPVIADYFYEIKRNKETYLLPSELIKELPIVIKKTEKIAHKGKAYHKIISYKTLKIIPEQTMTYKEKIDFETNIAHEHPDLLKLKAIIDDTAVNSRINIREISYPSWGKDSLLKAKSHIRGDIVSVTVPSIGKIKYLLAGKPKVLRLNEIQDMKKEEVIKIESFYIDTGDFSSIYTNPTRARDGTLEKNDITELSTISSYNFPDESKGESKKELFDFMFKPKTLTRIFPILWKGGNHKIGSLKEKYEKLQYPITKEEIDLIVKYLKADLFYGEGKFKYGLYNKKRNYVLSCGRWDDNFQRILARIDLYASYCDDYDGVFRKFEKLLYDSHIAYLDYIKEEAVVVEEEVVG